MIVRRLTIQCCLTGTLVIPLWLYYDALRRWCTTHYAERVALLPQKAYFWELRAVLGEHTRYGELCSLPQRGLYMRARYRLCHETKARSERRCDQATMSCSRTPGRAYSFETCGLWPYTVLGNSRQPRRATPKNGRCLRSAAHRVSAAAKVCSVFLIVSAPRRNGFSRAHLAHHGEYMEVRYACVYVIPCSFFLCRCAHSSIPALNPTALVHSARNVIWTDMAVAGRARFLSCTLCLLSQTLYCRLL